MPLQYEFENATDERIAGKKMLIIPPAATEGHTSEGDIAKQESTASETVIENLKKD